VRRRDKAKVEGAEMSLTLHPAGGLTITANGTYVDTRVDSNSVNPPLLSPNDGQNGIDRITRDF
jgi:iron complex outermembrane receptor protein